MWRAAYFGAGTWIAVLLSACGGDPTGPDENPFLPPAGQASCTSAPPLTQFPVPVSAIKEIGPLGSMTPRGHLFPATHLGIHFLPTVTDPLPLSAPGPIVIRQVRRGVYTSVDESVTEYAIFFYPCADVQMHFGHVSTLDPTIVSLMGGWEGAHCLEPDWIGDVMIESCTKDVSVEVSAGTLLGTQSVTMDFGAIDRRVQLPYVNPARFGAANQPFGQNSMVCAVDYLPPDVRASVHDLFGFGGQRRTAEPVCGTIMQDVAGTTQGRWFINDDWNEQLHLGLVRDYIDPSIGAFSVGMSIPTLPWDLYRFDPVDAGRVNLDFPNVRVDGLIYCYEPTSLAPDRHVILIQLLSDARLRIEGRPGMECGAPESWAFTAGAVEFDR